MDKIKYSILMPVYNAEKYLAKALDSILNQEFKDFEFIVINDGSTDQSLSILEKYQYLDQRLKVITNTNQGVFKTRLELIDKSVGEYILFIDSDDYVENNYLNVIEKEIEDSEVLTFNYYTLFKDKLTINEGLNDSFITNAKEMLSMIASTHNLNNLWSKCYQGDILREIIKKFDFSIFRKSGFAEDLFLNILYLENIHKVKVINEPLYVYRILEESLSRNISVDKIYDVLYDASIVYKRFLSSKLISEEKIYVEREFYKIIFNYLNVVSNAKLKTKEKIKAFEKINEIDFAYQIIHKYQKINISKYRKIVGKLYVGKKYKLLIIYLKLFNFIKKIIKVIKWTTKRQF